LLASSLQAGVARGTLVVTDTSRVGCSDELNTLARFFSRMQRGR